MSTDGEVPSMQRNSHPGKCHSAPRGDSGGHRPQCWAWGGRPVIRGAHRGTPAYEAAPIWGQLCLHWLETSCFASVQTCEENRRQREKQACKCPHARQGGGHVLSDPPGRPGTQAPAKPRSRACGGLQVVSPPRRTVLAVVTVRRMRHL